MKIRLELEHKIAIIYGTFVVNITAALLFHYWENPFWLGALIASIILWSCIGIITFSFIIVKFIRFQTNPDLSSKLMISEDKIRDLEKELNVHKKFIKEEESKNAKI